MPLNVDEVRAALERAKEGRNRRDVAQAVVSQGLSLVNKKRMASLNHTLEEQNDQEICVGCTILYDDLGDIVGATHRRYKVLVLEALITSGAVVVDSDGEVS